MDKVHICHDVQIGDNCVAGIGTTIAGECTLDDCVILSGNVTLHQYCHVGQWTLVQSGCRISKDVPPYSIMAGNPVEYHGVNAVVLQQHKNTSERVLRHIANALSGKLQLAGCSAKNYRPGSHERRDREYSGFCQRV